MFKEKRYRRTGRMRRRRYTINPVGVLILIARVFFFVAWLCSPFLLWGFMRCDHVGGGRLIPFKPYGILFMYVTMAADFVRNPHHFILQSPSWDTRIFIEKTTYEDEDFYRGDDQDDTYGDHYDDYKKTKKNNRFLR
jgi:hypothetical protein